MIRKQRWFVPIIALAAVSATLLGPIGSLNAFANEQDFVELEIIDELEGLEEAVEVNALEVGVELLTLAQAELAAEVLAESTPAEWPVIAAYAVNLLVGPDDEHFDEEYALASIDYGKGAIAYVEEIAGVLAEDFVDVDIAERINEGSETAETEALLRLLLAKDLLLQEDIDSELLTSAGHQITAAFTLLQDLIID